MGLKEFEYVVAIAEERNLTRAAQKLFITPSALTQQLQHLERTIGAKLFERVRSGWVPTAAGEIYLDAAKRILEINKDAYLQLQDIVDKPKGTISIGVPPERGPMMFTTVFPVFHQQFPEIVINIVETSVRRQQRMIAEGELDLGFMLLREQQKTDDEYIFIRSEELVLALPSGHQAAEHAKETAAGRYPELDIRLLREEPFAFMYKESTIFECIEDILKSAGVIPNILFKTVRANTIIDIVAAGMCCSIIPDADYVVHKEGVAFYCLPDHPTWDMVASYRRGGYLSQPVKRFVELAAAYWSN